LNKYTFRIVAVAVVLLASLNGIAQKVTFDFDKSADFSRAKTYAWIKGTPAANPNVDLYIMGVANHQLQQKGFAKVEPKDADLLIIYHAASSTNINVSMLDNAAYASSLGLPPNTFLYWWGAPQQATNARYIRKGNLAFEIIDRQRHQIIWTANTKLNLDDRRSKALDQVDKALIKVFDGYPPR
jgi:hypothetical protein